MVVRGTARQTSGCSLFPMSTSEFRDPSDLRPGALASYTVGSGARPVVLLHGFLGSGRNLRALAQTWSGRDPGRRFLVPDLSGHGASAPLAPGGTMEDMARAVFASAEGAGWSGPLTLVGHSLGGRVALAGAGFAPERIAEIVLLDIGPGPIEPATSESRRVLDVLLAAPAEVADRREMRAFLLGHRH